MRPLPSTSTSSGITVNFTFPQPPPQHFHRVLHFFDKNVGIFSGKLQKKPDLFVSVFDTVFVFVFDSVFVVDFDFVVVFVAVFVFVVGMLCNAKNAHA